VPLLAFDEFAMLEVLLESRGARTPRQLYGATISAVAHGAVVVLIVVGPSMRNLPLILQHEEAATTAPKFVAPPDRSAPPQQEHTQFMSVGGKGTEQVDEPEPTRAAQQASVSTDAQENKMGVTSARLAEDAYSVVEVDSAAVRDPSSAAPSYPPAMMSLNIEGAATIKFVVDTTGRIDLGTVQTIAATNPAFAHAVLDALPKMRFHPARVGALAVRQMAMEEFKFQLKRIALIRP
jgi:TonB family protein